MRKYVFAPALLVAVAVFSVAAGAAWLASGTGGSSSRSTSIGKPTNVNATATGQSSVQVTWGAPASPSPAPASYDVFRYFNNTGTKICTATTNLVCNDAGLQAGSTYGYTVEARLGSNWLSGQTTQVNATTQSAPVGTPNFKVELVAPGNKTAGTAFDVRVTAQNGTTTDATYTGSHNLTFSGPGQNAGFAAPTYPANGGFLAGVATVAVTLRKAETATLTVAEGARTGNTSVTIVAGDPSSVTYTSSRFGPNSGNTQPVTCNNGGVVAVGNGGTFFTKVTRAAFDASGNTVTGSAVTVAFSKSPNNGSGPGTATISANQTASNEVSLTIPTGQPAPITLTASIGAASVSCTIQRNPPQN